MNFRNVEFKNRGAKNRGIQQSISWNSKFKNQNASDTTSQRRLDSSRKNLRATLDGRKAGRSGNRKTVAKSFCKKQVTGQGHLSEDVDENLKPLPGRGGTRPSYGPILKQVCSTPYVIVRRRMQQCSGASMSGISSRLRPVQ